MTLTSSSPETIPVVCIGLSAGAVKPLKDLFCTLNPHTGMAFVVIHHLGRQHPSLLPGILSACTAMKVELAESGISLEPDHVYVMPSGSEISINDTTLEVRSRSVVRGWSNVVTVFIESLTRSNHPGIAVILSGLDHDGAAGLKAFKRYGGITIAQAPWTATCPDMPDAAISTGAVDYVLPPEGIATELERLARKLRLEA